MPKYLPQLSELIPIESIPSNFGFLQGGIQTIFSQLYFDNLDIDRGSNHGEAQLNLNLVSKSRLAIELQGTGIALVLNPSFSSRDSSEFPILISYQIDILKYIHDFHLSTFDFTPTSFFKILLQIGAISDENLVSEVINQYYSGEEIEDPIQSFIDAINTKYSPAPILTKPSLQDEKEIISNLVFQIRDTSNDFSISDIVINDYILNGTNGNPYYRIERFFFPFIGNFTLENLKNIFIPSFTLAIYDISLALEFPRTVLLPLDNTGSIITDESIKSKVVFNAGSLNFDSRDGFSFEEISTISFSKSAIGNTGFSLEFNNMLIDFSTKSNIREAIADGRPEDFIGVYVTDSTITFPASWLPATGTNASSGVIKGRNLLIGTGGISGKISLEAINGTTPTPLINFKFGDFLLRLNAFTLTFQQNSITQSDILGTLVFPEKYNQTKIVPGSNPPTTTTSNAELLVKVCILQNGDFKISAIDTGNLLQIEYDDVFVLDITSISAGREEGKFYVDAAAILKFNAAQTGLPDGILPKEIQINQCRIWEDGKLDIAVSGLKLPHAFNINLGPMKLNVSNIHFGSHEENNRSYNFFGFDGSVDFKPGGVEARGNGIKFYFNTDNGTKHRFLRVDGIGIDIRLPANAKSASEAEFLFKGYLGISNIPNEGGSNEYSGSIAMAIKRFSLQGGAAMRYQPETPTFLVDLGLELGSPIPLGATGLGIYGFKGLFGQNYTPSMQAAGLAPDDSYWKYYKAKRPGNANPEWNKEGIHAGKFGSGNGNSFGAGVSLATGFDGGRTLSTKLFAMLGVPGGLMVQGQAGILAKRLGLADPQDPPFSVLLVINNSKVSADLGIHYTLPNQPDSGEPSDSKGSILDLKAHAEMAYFFNDSKAWYINLGKDQPEEARVKSRILSLFDGYSYLMLSARGIKIGAGAGFDFNAKYGPASVGAGLYVSATGFVNFRPSQIGGLVQAGGYAYVKIFRFKLGLQLDVSLGAEAPKPFIIEGKVNVNINLPRPIPDFSFGFELKWVKTRSLNTMPLPIIVGIENDTIPSRKPAKAINIMAGESFDVFVFDNSANNFLTNPSVEEIRNNLKDFSNDQYHAAKDKYTIPLDSYIDIDLSRSVARNSNLPIGDVISDVLEFTETVPKLAPRVENIVQHEFRLVDFKILYFDKMENIWRPYNIYTNNTTLNALANQLVSEGKIGNINQLFSAFWQKVEKNLNKRIRVLALQPFSYTQLGSPGSVILEHQGFNLEEIFCGKSKSLLKNVNWLDSPLGVIYPTPGIFNMFKGVGFKWFSDTGYEVISSNLTVGNNTFNKAIQFDLKDGFEIKFSEALSKIDLYWQPNWASFVGYEVNYNIEVFDGADKFIARIENLPSNNVSNPLFSINRNILPGQIGFGRLKFNLITIQPSPNSPKINNTNLIIGRANSFDNFFLGGIPGQSSHFNGWIANIKLIKTSLNEETIIEILQGNSAIQNSSDLLLSFSLNDTLLPETNNLNGGASIAVVEENFNSPVFEDYQTLDNSTVKSLFIDTFNNYKIDHHDDIAFDWESFTIAATFALKETNQNELRYQVIIDKRKIVNGLTYAESGYSLFVFNNQICFQFIDPLNKSANSLWLDTELAFGCAYSIAVVFNRENGEIKLYLYDVEGNNIYSAQSKIIFSKPSGMDLSLKLYQLSYETITEEQYNQSIITPEALSLNLNLMKEAYNGLLQPIWRPETLYAIELKMTDTISPSENSIYTSHSTILFKTRGPIGNFHLHNETYQKLIGQEALNAFKFENLKHYIDVNTSYPNPEGKIDGEKPLFYQSPKLRLNFLHEYVKLMFETWNSVTGLPEINSTLKIEVLETTNRLVEEEIDLVWVEDELGLTIEHDEIRTLNFIVKHKTTNNLILNCQVSNLGPFAKRNYYFEAQLPDLKPNKLYQAIYKLEYNQTNQESIVLKYNFRSSKYPNLESQLNQYYLEGSLKNNLPDTEVELNQVRLTEAYNAIADGIFDPELQKFYPDKFSRILEGVLTLPHNNFPINGTEVLRVVNKSPGFEGILGIILRSDEPFYTPMLGEEIMNILSFEVKTTQQQTNFNAITLNVIPSEDFKQIFITQATNSELGMRIGMNFWELKVIFNHYDSNLLPTGDNSTIIIGSFNNL